MTQDFNDIDIGTLPVNDRTAILTCALESAVNNHTQSLRDEYNRAVYRLLFPHLTIADTAKPN